MVFYVGRTIKPVSRDLETQPSPKITYFYHLCLHKFKLQEVTYYVKTHFYKAFGFIFESDFEIPEFTPTQETRPDIRISVGPAPDGIPSPSSQGVLFQGSSSEFLLKVPNAGKIFVANGDTICVDKNSGAPWDDIRVFMLSSGMGALLHQRELLPMHASAIDLNGRVAMFMGNSGVGKSTLAAAFSKRGAHILADDISLIRHTEENSLLVPAFPQVKLWEDSLKKLEDNPQDLKKVRAELGKYWKTITERFQDQPKPVTMAFLLSPVNTNEFSINRLKGIEKFNVLKNNTYKFRFIHGSGLEKNHFGNISRLANNVAVFKTERPSGGFELDKLVDLLLEQMNTIES